MVVNEGILHEEQSADNLPMHDDFWVTRLRNLLDSFFWMRDIEILLSYSLCIVIIFLFESDFQIYFCILWVYFFALYPKVKIFLIFWDEVIRSFHLFKARLV